jgi:hypothetical protein
VEEAVSRCTTTVLPAAGAAEAAAVTTAAAVAGAAVAARTAAPVAAVAADRHTLSQARRTSRVSEGKRPLETVRSQFLGRGIISLLNVGRSAFLVCVAAAVLAGCGGSQPPVGAPGAVMPGAVAPARAHRKSGSSDALIYASTPKNFDYVIDYATGALVARFRAPVLTIYGMCTDSAGDIYMLGAATNGNILKYAHGATKPSENIVEYELSPRSCSVDPTTGNVAILNLDSGDKAEVSVFANGSGRLDLMM